MDNYYLGRLSDGRKHYTPVYWEIDKDPLTLVNSSDYLNKNPSVRLFDDSLSLGWVQQGYRELQLPKNEFYLNKLGDHHYAFAVAGLGKYSWFEKARNGPTALWVHGISYPELLRKQWIY